MKERRREKTSNRKILRRFLTFCFTCIILVATIFLIGLNKGDKYLDITPIKAETIFRNNNSPLNGKIIVVDSGHGGVDSGTLAPISKIYESDLNLKFGYLLEKKLEELGANVVMTRTEESTEKLGTDKKLDIENRGEIIEEADADMLISIHQNFNDDSSDIRGTQILVRDNDSLDFATSLQETFNEELGVNLNYILADYHILNYGNQPSVIVEFGFFSNPQEEVTLQTDKYQQRLIKILCDEIEKYFSLVENE